MLNFSPPRRLDRKPAGAKLALKPVHVWGIRIRLQVARKARDLALSTWRWTTSCAAVTLSGLRLRICFRPAE